MMKILVDKLPASPSECRFHEGKVSDRLPIGKNWIDGCAHSRDRNFQCKIGQEGFDCPYYKEFKAESVEVKYVSEDTFCEKRVPVELKE